MKLEFYRQILENMEISNFMKICTIGTELFYAGRQTDRYDENNSRFSFAKAVRELQMLLQCASCHHGKGSLLSTNGGYHLQNRGYWINGLEKATKWGSSGWGCVRT
jgi:hypothetical protein